MTDFEATSRSLMQAVCESPADDTPRLVIADLFEENGEPDRGAFIRVQCELAGPEFSEWQGNPVFDLPEELIVGFGNKMLKKDGSIDKRRLPKWPAAKWQLLERYIAIRRRERELLEAHAADWVPYWPGAESLVVEKGGTSVVVYAAQPPMSAQLTFRRGFIDSITCTAADWLAVADSLAWCPGKCQAIGPHHGDRCSGGRVQSPNAQFTEDCRACRGSGKVPPTVVCPGCDGKRYTLRSDLGAVDCYVCREPVFAGKPTGRVPRAFAGTEQPIAKVVLTTGPTLDEISAGDFYRVRDEWGLPMESRRWPGITFELPATV